MELGRGAAGEAPSSSVEGYFTNQALRAGLLRDVGRSSIRAPPTSLLITAREVLKRELQREQVRDDLTQRRVLEEEVRRELDFERSMADRLVRLRRAPLYPDANRLAPCPPEARVGERPGTVPGSFPASRQRAKVEFVERIPFHARRLHPNVVFVERMPLQDPQLHPDVGFVERLPIQDPRRRLEDGFIERLPLRHPHQRPEDGILERLPRRDVYQHPDVGFTEWLPHQDLYQHREAGFVDRLSRQDLHYPEVQVVERLAPPVFDRLRDAQLDERPAFEPRPKTVSRDKKSASHSGPQIRKRLPRHEKDRITLTKGNAMRSGVKRKAESSAGAEEFHQPPAKKWNCDLCKVFTTCEQGLKEHFEGKKHKAIEESLNTDKPATHDSVSLTSIDTNKFKDSVKAKGTHKLLSAKKNSKAKKAKNPFWCNVCKVQCNSQVILNSHLGGKKHKLQLEESKEKPDIDRRKDKPMKTEKPTAIQESDKKAAKDGKLVAAGGPEGNKLPVANTNLKDMQPAKENDKPLTAVIKITDVVKATGKAPKQPTREAAADEAAKAAD